MPVDNDMMFAPATRADVAKVALAASSAILHVKMALKALASGKGGDAEISKLSEDVEALGHAFDELTGWTDK